MKDDLTFMADLPPTNARYVVFDTETTGLNLNYDHILELAAIEVINGALTGNLFQVYIKPRTKIRKEATEVNNMDNDFYRKNYEKVYENERQLLINFLTFVDNCIIFAHNASFDCNFINKELEFHKLPKIPKEKFRCTMRIYKKFTVQNKIVSYSLESCAQNLQIESDKKRLHSGIYDAEICAKFLLKLFEKYNVNEKTHETVKSSSSSVESCLRIIGDLNGVKSCNPNYVQGLGGEKKEMISQYSLPDDRDKAAKELRSGLLSTIDQTCNNSSREMNNSEFLSDKELSVCITDFDNLSLNYTDSKVTTNTLNLKDNFKNNNTIQEKYDEKMKALKDINRSYVINTLNNPGHDQNTMTSQKIHDDRRKEFEKKIDRNTLREHFQNFNK
jgi:DNA polymerase-3 subunit epsilon